MTPAFVRHSSAVRAPFRRSACAVAGATRECRLRASDRRTRACGYLRGSSLRRLEARTARISADRTAAEWQPGILDRSLPVRRRDLAPLTTWRFGADEAPTAAGRQAAQDRKSTRLNSSHSQIS